MFRKLFTAVLLTVASLSFAQTPALKGDGRITGVLTDSTANTPVEFATLSLFRVPNLTQPVDGAMTDDKGKFDLKDLAYGDYVIRFSFIGYSDKTSDVISVSPTSRVVNLGNVLLAPSARMLKEVEITGQAAVIEERVDRLVYNADKDITSKGGDATEILRKVPLLSVDLDGNVQLRGSSSIRVLINNKPSTIMATSVADALRQIPADQVKTVEVITSPSAKYDAEGATGIVNIITKKNNLEGYSLGVDLGGGNRGANLGLNGNLKMGKLGFTLGGWGRGNYNPTKTDFFQEGLGRIVDTTYITNQHGDGKDKMFFGRYSLGMDYDISTTKSISAGARFGAFSFNRDQDLLINEYRKFEGVETALRNSHLAVTNKMPTNSWDFNLDYLHVIKPQKEFSISTLYSRTNSNSSFTRTPLAGSEGMIFNNDNDSRNQEFTLQADYTTPVKTNQAVELGVKGIFRVVDSEFKNVSSRGQSNMESVGDLAYNQSIGAAYLGYTYSTKNKYTFKVGGRYEFTDISASTLGLMKETRNQLDIPSYGNFIPSVNISKTFARKYTAKLAYNQRIQRPGMQHLNPNENQSNPLRISRGNPQLDPEISNNLEASLSAGINKLYVNFSVFTRFTDNAISSMTTKFEERGEGVTLTTFENVGKSQTTGINFFGNYQITSKWSVNSGIEAFYMVFKGLAPNLDGLSMDFSSKGWNLNGRLMSQISLNKGWQIQGFGFMRGNSVIAQGTQSGWGHYALGFRKEFANKKGSIGLNAQNFFKDHMKFTSTLNTFQNIQRSTDYRYNRGFNVTFNYKIGKMGPEALKPKKRAKGVKNDDLKDAGGEQQQQQ
ncbi:MAG: TonB-dependent receptor [Leadbetterella sp.]|nr:TonB-dependent receptor [Leadbetterella sp.]